MKKAGIIVIFGKSNVEELRERKGCFITARVSFLFVLRYSSDNSREIEIHHTRSGIIGIATQRLTKLAFRIYISI